MDYWIAAVVVGSFGVASWWLYAHLYPETESPFVAKTRLESERHDSVIRLLKQYTPLPAVLLDDIAFQAAESWGT